MNKNSNYTIQLILLNLALILFSISTNAQEVRVIDNKGTLTTINKVTTSSTAPTDPVTGDVWYDDTIPAETIGKIYDGTNWIYISRIGTPGSVFFADTDGTPTENNSQLFWDNTNQRLNIGNPLNGNNKLTVQGGIRATNTNNANGTANRPSYRFSSDANTGMYRIGSDQLGFSTKGINALAIDATQNVSLPQNLSVTGSYADSSGDTGDDGQILSSTNTGTNWIDPPSIKAMGKIAANGNEIKITTGYEVTRTGLVTGRYRINIPAGFQTDANYIIQLTALATRGGNGGNGGDDNYIVISYYNQTITGFNVEIKNYSGNLRDKEFMFTILDF